MVRVRARIAGGQVVTDWHGVQPVQQRDGRRIAHVRLNGDDFRPPVELNTELLIDVDVTEGERT